MRVAVIGGGYAGMAAAVTLAEAGVAVTLFEAGRELGGRARRVLVNDVALDNGLHILVGAYSETLRLVHAVNARPDNALARLPFDWRVHGRFRLKAANLPAPLHLAAGLLCARGAPFGERVRAARFIRAMRARRYRITPDVPVDTLLAQYAQGPTFTRYLWQPLCLAALNTPPQLASAQVFLNVLRDGLDAHRSAGDMLLARVDLSTLFPQPAAQYVRERGGEILMGHTVEALKVDADRVRLRARGRAFEVDHAICAVSPHRAAAILESEPRLADTVALLERFRYQPIYSVYLQFGARVRVPAPMVGFDGTAQWLFDREAICGQRGLLAAVISAEGPHQALTQDALAHAVHTELDHAFGPLPRLLWHRVIAEKRATFECAVDLVRPATRTPLARLHLAGDYTASDYPATLEAATRSGVTAARQVLAKATL